MSWSTEIDRALRHSVVGRMQPAIKARTPWLHKLLLQVRDIVLPFRSRNGLTRYQHRALERYRSFGPDLSLPVLEVGSDLGCAVLAELTRSGARVAVGVNPMFSHGDVAPRAGGARHLVVKGDGQHLGFRDRAFGSVFTVAAFEHILDLPQALRELHRVLKPGGLVYADFGPIWSSTVGHHVYAEVDGVEARHHKPGRNPVPHHAHLLMTPEELRPRLFEAAWMFPRMADAIIEWIYRGDGINRLFYEDYVRAFAEAPFDVVHLEPVRERVPTDVMTRLRERWPGYSEFDVRMAEVVLRREK